MSEVSQKTREYWVAKARGWAERLSGPQDDEFNAVMDDIMLSASRAEAAEARLAERAAEVARLTAKLQSAKSEVDEILRAALSGDYDRYLNYDLQGNKYCKWGVVSRDIAAVFDVTEPSDIDVSEQGFND